MNQGREFDILVAVKVMGLEIVNGYVVHHSSLNTMMTTAIPPYSTNISAAWEVVEHLSPGLLFDISRDKNGYYSAGFYKKAYHGKHKIPSFEKFGLGEGITAPHSICLAALKVVDREEV